MKRLIRGCIGLVQLPVAVAAAQAHHSFAIFDINNKIQRTGTLTRFDFIQPHVIMALRRTSIPTMSSVSKAS